MKTRKSLKKIMSCELIVAMVACILPANVFAAPIQDNVATAAPLETKDPVQAFESNVGFAEESGSDTQVDTDLQMS